MATDLAALKEDLTRRMDGALETLRREFAGLRTGRASPGLLEPVRRDGNEQTKAIEKKHLISEDEAKTWTDEIQKLTDGYIKRIDESLADKEREIKQV